MKPLLKYEYRIESMYYEGSTKYHIERSEEGKNKWKLLFGNLTREQANKLLENPNEIESINIFFKRFGIGILIFFLLDILFLSIMNYYDKL